MLHGDGLWAEEAECVVGVDVLMGLGLDLGLDLVHLSLGKVV